jgi:hypothetical protein
MIEHHDHYTCKKTFEHVLLLCIQYTTILFVPRSATFQERRYVGCLYVVRRPDIRVKYCTYVHSVTTPLNPRGVTTVSHKYSLTVARHVTVVVAVPSAVHHPANYKLKIYYLRLNLKV